MWLETTRFDERTKRGVDNGRDFEAFVRDCLERHRRDRLFWRSIRGGPDGAIDLRGASADGLHVGECKFIGRDATTRPRDVWRDVAGALTESLPELAGDLDKRAGSPYRRWLDADNPILSYTFCVAAPLTGVEREAIEADIRATFRSLAEATGRPHLARIADEAKGVEVLSWDDFTRILGNDPGLRFAWFGGWPTGVRSFGEVLGRATGFRAFLRENALPYFSRADFARDEGFGPRDETALLDALEDEDPFSALVLSGPGGVGKTRLSLEIGAQLRARGWHVYALGQTATAEAALQLVRGYGGDARIAFVLDYAEAATAFDGLPDALDQVAQESRRRVRLVVNCRASAAAMVESALSGLPVVPVRLAAGQTEEERYARWVARRILDTAGLGVDERLAAICRLPALAAFAVFLKRERPADFEEQFGALHDVADFEGWATRRITALLRGVEARVGRSTLCDLALSLPLPLAERDALADGKDERATLLARLEDDGWIERDEDGAAIAPAHDVLADALAAHDLFGPGADPTRRAGDALRRAAADGRLPRALVALDRLAAHPRASEAASGRIVSDLLRAVPDAMRDAAPVVMRSRFLGWTGRLAALGDAGVRAAVGGDVMLANVVAHLCDSVADLDPEAHERLDLSALLDTASSLARLLPPGSGNMILRSAYRLAPAEFRDALRDRVGVEPVASQTHYLLVALLRGGEPPLNLAPYVEAWLQRHADGNLKTSFVLAAWLDAGGAPDRVEAEVEVWLANRAAEPEARFVYKAWLGAGGAPDRVEAPIEAWLARHAAEPEARFVYQAWLDAGGAPDRVEAPIEAWLARHAAEPVAQFVYKAWLAAGGAVDRIEAAIESWLARHAAEPEARFVYKAWLDANGAIGGVAAAIAIWLASHAAEPEAGFVYKAWLDAGGAVDRVEAATEAWIACHGAEQEAGFVYQAWLDAGGAIDHVEAPIESWLANYAAAPEAQFVYKAWLDAGGEIDRVEAAIRQWLTANETDERSDFVIKAWLDVGGSIDDVLEPAVAWLRRNWRRADAAFVTKPLSKVEHLPQEAIVLIGLWAREYPANVDAVYRLANIAKDRPEPHDELSVRAILAGTQSVLGHFGAHLATDPVCAVPAQALVLNCHSLSRPYPPLALAADRLVSRAIGSTPLYRRGTRVRFDENLLTACHSVLSAGFFTPADAAGVEAFIGWLDEQRPGDPFVAHLAQRLRAAITAPRWTATR
ncbi:hypothetical protein [Salinarimonas rosea]|uniref:hypothetical protein n=1 Tax=Salinarimonas rosea TaxID=552063 RepID=UPI00041FCC09|nr:hypothetical protein [Salinarimonas rosea]